MVGTKIKQIAKHGRILKESEIQVKVINMGFMRIVVALVCFFAGICLTFTVVGAIIGIPLLAAGIYLLYKEQRLRAKEVISGGIKEGLAEVLKERDKDN